MLIATLFANAKSYLETTLHLSRDALHVHIGIALFFAMVFVLQRHPRRFVLALAGLLALCFINEAMDVYNARRSGYPPNWLGGAKDIINTMFWPAVVVYAGPAIARLFGFDLTPIGDDAPVRRLTWLEPPSQARPTGGVGDGQPVPPQSLRIPPRPPQP